MGRLYLDPGKKKKSSLLGWPIEETHLDTHAPPLGQNMMISPDITLNFGVLSLEN